MFNAIVLVCALAAGGNSEDSCVNIEDELGPYKTEQACENRIKSMVEILETDKIFRFYVEMRLGFPELMSVNEICLKEDLLST